MLGPWRSHWTQTAHSAQFCDEFCPHSSGPLRSKHFQKNESYFHNLYINWDWMDYAISVELFIDLKPRNCEEWNDNITISWDFLRQTAPAAMPRLLGAVSRKKNLMILSFCNIVKGQATCRMKIPNWSHFDLPRLTIPQIFPTWKSK